jgi:hypothetical protein
MVTKSTIRKELNEEFNVPGLIKRVCCVCQKAMGYKRSGSNEYSAVSHGYCNKCYEVAIKEA